MTIKTSFLLLISFKFLINGQLITGPCPDLPEFPPHLQFSIHPFSTYSKEIQVPFAYYVFPRSAHDVVELVNWAFLHQFRVRAVGFQNSWSPLIFSATDDGAVCPKYLLVDTTKHFTSMTLNPTDYGRPDLHSVTVGPGVKLGQLLEFLESKNLGLFSSPSFGSVTVGGMLAIGAHGSGVASSYDHKSIGHTYGTFSNLVIEMTIVAWNPQTYFYELKTIHRSDPEAKAFLVNLGRTFVTSVTLRVGQNQMLRSQSHFFIPVKEMFASPNIITTNQLFRRASARSRSLEKYVESYGRVSVVGMSTGKESYVWVITWKAEGMKPPRSRLVSTPYNYYFANYFAPSFVDPLLKREVKSVPSAWNFVSLPSYPALLSGSVLSRSIDFWGPSKNHLLYLSKYTLHQRPNAFVVLTSRRNLQLVAFIMRSHFDKVSQEYQRRFSYPSAGVFNVRVSGVDDPQDVEIPGAEAPSFSNASPSPEFPDFDTVLWFEFSAYGETPNVQEFVTKLQSLYYRDIHGVYGILRVEWSKGWAHTDFGPWTNSTVIKHFARVFSASDNLKEWNWAVKVLNGYDPNSIFSNDFLDQLLVPQ